MYLWNFFSLDSTVRRRSFVRFSLVCAQPSRRVLFREPGLESEARQSRAPSLQLTSVQKWRRALTGGLKGAF